MKPEHSEDSLPPDRLSARIAEDVGAIKSHLRKVAAEIEPSWHLSTALAVLQRTAGRRDGGQIAACQRDRLLAALERARPAAVSIFAPAEQVHAARGIDAAAVLVVMWGESEEQRAARHRHTWADASARLKILRYTADIACMLEEIAARADARIIESVTEMVRKAIAA